MTKPLDADIKALKTVVRGLKMMDELPEPHRSAAFGWAEARIASDRRKLTSEDWPEEKAA